jgi:hypothetical protein
MRWLIPSGRPGLIDPLVACRLGSTKVTAVLFCPVGTGCRPISANYGSHSFMLARGRDLKCSALARSSRNLIGTGGDSAIVHYRILESTLWC